MNKKTTQIHVHQINFIFEHSDQFMTGFFLSIRDPIKSRWISAFSIISLVCSFTCCVTCLTCRQQLIPYPHGVSCVTQGHTSNQESFYHSKVDQRMQRIYSNCIQSSKLVNVRELTVHSLVNIYMHLIQSSGFKKKSVFDII